QAAASPSPSPAAESAAFQSATTLLPYLLPDKRQHFAAETLARRLATAHDSIGGAEDCDSEPAQDPRDLRLARVNTQAGAADPLHTRDHAGAVGARLEDDTHRLGGAVRVDLVPGDVALVLQDAGNLELQL